MIIKEEEYEVEKNKFNANTAYTLALGLKDDEPCPVCGSVHHPSPALNSVDCLNSEQLNELEKEKEDFLVKKESSERFILEKQNDLKVLNLGDIDDIDKLIDEQNILLNDLIEKKNNLKDEYDSLLEDKNANELELKEKKTTLNNFETNKNNLEKEINDEMTDLEELFNQKNTNKDEYDRLIISSEEFKELNDRINLSNEELNILKGSIEEIEKRVKNKSKIDVAQMEVERDAYKNKEGEYDSEISNSDIIQSSMVRCKNRLETDYKQYQSTLEEYNRLEKLYLYCSANNDGKIGRKISLENYVQSYYLDRVLVAANERLYKLADNEFELVKKTETIGAVSKKDNKLGIEFMVKSNSTNYERRPKDLSGGEKFKVALALALGISEIIATSAGGVKMESIFIDEGFGHLDTESLETAYSILSDLSKSNKLIGIISHVESLKQLIKDKTIVVTKDNNGSKVEINA